MASCGPPPPRAAATPAAAATAAARAAATPGAAAIHAAATPSKDNASTSSDILAAAPHATAAAVLIPGSTSTHMKVNVAATSVRRCPLPGPTSRSCTSGSVRGTNQGKNVMLPASPRRQEASSVHTQRYQGFDPTSAQGIILYYTFKAICQKCMMRT